MNTKQQIYKGIPVGEYLGSGAFSKVYNHPNQDDKVLMFGCISNDLFKIMLYNEYGFLFGFNNLENGSYVACLKKLQDRHNDGIKSKLDSIVNLTDDVFCNADTSDSFDSNTSKIRWLELATNPTTPPSLVTLVNLLIKFDFTGCHFDNHTGNWLYDPDSDQMLPMDIANADTCSFDRDTTTETIKKMTSPIPGITPAKEIENLGDIDHKDKLNAVLGCRCDHCNELRNKNRR